MEKKIRRDLNSLEEISQLIVNFVAGNNLGDSMAYTLNLAVEELFVNMVKYNPGNTNDVLIELSLFDNSIIVSLTDYDVDFFDITQVKEYDRFTTLKERKVGGVGIYLVKKVMDDVRYDYRDRKSKITLIKYLGSKNVYNSKKSG
jgi:anti-sigma regulatory factor (Ser/Thr protein kinase)